MDWFACFTLFLFVWIWLASAVVLVVDLTLLFILSWLDDFENEDAQLPILQHIGFRFERERIYTIRLMWRDHMITDDCELFIMLYLAIGFLPSLVAGGTLFLAIIFWPFTLAATAITIALFILRNLRRTEKTVWRLSAMRGEEE